MVEKMRTSCDAFAWLQTLTVDARQANVQAEGQAEGRRGAASLGLLDPSLILPSLSRHLVRLLVESQVVTRQLGTFLLTSMILVGP